MSERDFELTQDRKRKFDAASNRIGQYISTLAQKGDRDGIIYAGRKLTHIDSLRTQLREQALNQEAQYYVSTYASSSQEGQPIIIDSIVKPTTLIVTSQHVEVVKPKPSAGEIGQVASKSEDVATKEIELPKLQINLATKEIILPDGSIKKIKGKVAFNVLRVLGQKAPKPVSIDKLDETAKIAGSKTRSPGASTVANLRVGFVGSLISNGERNKKGERTYVLNADVEFIGERPITTIRKQSRDIHKITLPSGEKVDVMGTMRVKVINRLLQASEDKPVSTIQLAKEILGNGSRASKKRVTDNITFAKVVLREHDLDLNIKTDYQKTRGRTKKQKIVSYFVREREAESKEKQEEFLNKPVLESRLDALNKFMDHVDVGIEEIIDILGPSKTGRRLTNPQAVFALKRAVNVLYLRIGKHITTEREEETFKKIKDGTLKDSDKDAIDTFKFEIESWVKTRKGVSREEVSFIQEEEGKGQKRLSADEAGVLSLLILRHKGVKINFGNGQGYRFDVDSSTEEVCRRLTSNISFKDGELKEEKRGEYLGLRSEAIKKAGNILESPDMDEVLDSHEDDAKTLLIWLYCQDEDKMHGLLFNFLEESPELFWTLEKNQLQRLWHEWTPAEPIKEAQSTSELKQISVAVVDEEVDVQSEVQATPDLSVLDQSQYDAVKHDKRFELSPEETVILDATYLRLEENNVKKPIGGAQLTRLFSKITTRFQDEVIEKRFINPPKNKHKVPQYDQVDVLYIVLYYELGGNLKRRDAKDLRKRVEKFLEGKKS